MVIHAKQKVTTSKSPTTIMTVNPDFLVQPVSIWLQLLLSGYTIYWTGQVEIVSDLQKISL